MIAENRENYEKSYLKQYYERIRDGKQIVNEFVDYELQRFVDLLEVEGMTFNVEKIHRILDKIQKDFKFSNGKPCRFSLYQKVVLEVIFAYEMNFKKEIQDENGDFVEIEERERFFNALYLEQAKKMGKTELIAFMNIILKLYYSDIPGLVILNMAPVTEQANILINALDLITTNSPYHKQFKTSLTYPRKTVFKKTGAITKVIPATAARLQGEKPLAVIVDEEHLIKDDLRPAIENSLLAHPTLGLIIVITTAGTMRDGMYDAHEVTHVSAMREKDLMSREAVFKYVLDDPDELSNPKMWIKAMPNLGVSYTSQALAKKVERAKVDNEARVQLLTTIFGIKANSSLAYFNDEHSETHPIPDWVWDEQYCVLGVDLSLTSDFCCIAIMTFREGKFYTEMLNIKPLNSDLLMNDERKKFYADMMSRGFLHEFPEPEIDTERVAYWVIDELEKRNLVPRAIAYDSWYSAQFMSVMRRRYGTSIGEKIVQGPFTWAEPMKQIKRDFNLKNIIFECEILADAIRNVIAIEDINGNYRPHKKSSGNKIDAFMAFFNAYIWMMRIGFEKHGGAFRREEVD